METNKIIIDDKVLFINKEQDGTDSIIYYDPIFLKDEKLTAIKNHLFNDIKDWQGISKLDTKLKKSPRLQRWSQLDNNNFHDVWPKEFERWNAMPYHDWLLEFQVETKNKLTKIFDVIKQHTPDLKIPNINSILLNYYRDENDAIQLHQDRISEFGENPTIISCSFGETRTFNLKRVKYIENSDRYFKINEDEQNLNQVYDLTDGSMIIMAGSTQKYYAHEIPKTSEAKTGRISAVFREHNK